MGTLPPNSTPRATTVAALVSLSAAVAAQGNTRPPAVPLIAHDPYFSVWSTSDQLYGSPTTHWTGKEQSLTSLVRIDGTTYRLMGAEPKALATLTQVGLEVLPTETIYTFQGAGTQVRLSFTTPALPEDLDVLSRPATYITWEVKSTDQKSHKVDVYFDASAQLTVNRDEQKVRGDRPHVSGLTTLRIGSEDQPVLGKRGDDLRIDWGYLYVAAPESDAKGVIAPATSCADSFVKGGRLPGRGLGAKPRAVSEDHPVAALTFSLGSIQDKPVSRHAIVAYDDEYSITYFGKKLRPYWRRYGATAETMLVSAEKEYEQLRERCRVFDAELVADLARVGGSNYAWLGALAYRQCFAAHKIVADGKGMPLMFSKENFSNGCIATVDVLYPAAPQLLFLSPTLTKASLVPVLAYAASPRWKFPFAPHDLGTYPLANGQVYGGGERTEDDQMPVEESGNLLILLAALAKYEGNADFSAPYWPQISKWAEYLADKGFDPERQLSTDDFAGHLAHNVNLSVKAIEALGAYAYLCDLRGESATGSHYRGLAQEMAERWVKEAADGDHYRLAFDKPGTWSQKYNLVWDRLLGIGLFPKSVARTELDYYLAHQNAFGLPLDSRRDYTKLDWIVWTATLTGERSDFDALIEPIVKFLNETPDRAPMPDWFRTEVPRKEGFQARSVVGGVFIKMLDEAAVWRKWAGRGPNLTSEWAKLPVPPEIRTVVPTLASWRYTTAAPANGWSSNTFDDSSWKTATAGFGTAGTPGGTINTTWDGSDIWIRRSFDLPTMNFDELRLFIHHDEDAEVYVNGSLVANLPGYSTEYEAIVLPVKVRRALKASGNVIAIHCRQTGGGQYIDAGFVTVHPVKQ